MKHNNESASLEVLLFSLDEPRYALNLSAVETVIRMVELTPLPGAPEIVQGMINYHGRIIPLVNIRRRFNLPERDRELNDRVIIARTFMRPVALTVDSIIGIRTVEASEISETGHALPFAAYIQGAAKVDGDIILIYDLDLFLSLDEEQQLNNSLPGGAI
jgi:purine-binding chemotaxis protein CheW